MNLLSAIHELKHDQYKCIRPKEWVGTGHALSLSNPTGEIEFARIKGLNSMCLEYLLGEWEIVDWSVVHQEMDDIQTLIIEEKMG